MKAPPKGWPRISSSVYYLDAGRMIDWLCDAFGFETRLRIEGEGGRIEHSELTFGDDGLIMVGQVGVGKDWKARCASPQQVGKVTQGLCVFVDDCDAHCAAARAKGAEIFMEPTTSDYGDDYWVDRSYGALDPEGHHWWFMQRIKTGAGHAEK